MLPSRLRLKNFMCYRGSENEVDFTGIHLACVTGDNGQGKSALLDAMTWALWGKARTNSADDLITYGESDMEVQFEFEMGGARYRVIRQRSSAGRGSSGLELQGRTESGFYASFSEATIRDTQKRVSDLLRLDYDTFVNSAFLLQGRADEFTIKRPAERKQILADILGLAQYDEFAGRARDRSKEAEARRQLLARELEEIRQTVAEIPQIEADVINAEATVRQLDETVREANDALQRLFDQRRVLDAKADARTQAERRIKEARGEIAVLSKKLGERRKILAEFQGLLARADEIEQAMAALVEARAAKERWDELLQRILQLQNESSGLQGVVAEARSKLRNELGVVEERINAAQSTLKRHGGRERELAEARSRVEQLELLQVERDERQRELLQWKEASGTLNAQNTLLREQMNTLRERMNLLEGSEGAECPVCRQPLSPDARARALTDAESEGRLMGDRYRENQRQMAKAKHKIGELEAQIQSATRQLTDFGQWQRRVEAASMAAEEIRRAHQALSGAEQEAARLHLRLESGDYAHEAQAELARLASASASLGYDAAQHEAARRNIQQLGAREPEYKGLENARQQHATVLEVAQMFEQQILQWQNKIVADEEEIQKLNIELRQQEALTQQTHAQRVLCNNLQRDKTTADRLLGGARQRLEFAEQHAARQPEAEKAHHEAIEQRTVFEQLVNAFGKRGMQAMIIESAIPDIEAEANALLGRMTDGRMSVALLTQRESKAGDSTIETLDIVISDEYGERPYETFSGGEAFRINFALRIALSKLLAHRAGTNLRTLVIDEGFGSQDAQGRDRLVEAITSVQDDFDLVLVITHIDELKDAFPMRIDVVKSANGSRVVMG